MAFHDVDVRQKKARNTSELWFEVQSSVESFHVGESSGRTSVRISDVVGVGQGDNLPKSVPIPELPSAMGGSGKRKSKTCKTHGPVP